MAADPYGLRGTMDRADDLLRCIVAKATAMHEGTLRGRDALSDPTLAELEAAASTLVEASTELAQVLRDHREVTP